MRGSVRIIGALRIIGTLLALLSAGAPGLRAQDVLAAVIDASTGDPIASARIEVAGVEGGRMGLTDASGRLTLYNLERGELGLRASAFGYAPTELEVEVPGSGFLPIVVELEPAPVELEGINVEVAERIPYLRLNGFYDRSASNRGYYYDAERMDGMPATSVAGKLRSLRRIRRARDGTISIGTCRDPHIWVDRLFMGAQDLDRAMRPEDIVGVEIYDQPNLIPVRFRSGSGACAAIVIWSVKR